MFGFYVIKRYEMRTYTCPLTNLHTFDLLSLHKVWKWLVCFWNETTIDYHHGSV